MEDKKSYNLMSASWRTKKASCFIQSESKGLGTRGTDGDDLSSEPGGLRTGGTDGDDLSSEPGGLRVWRPENQGN